MSRLNAVAAANTPIGRQPASRSELNSNSRPMLVKAAMRNRYRSALAVSRPSLPPIHQANRKTEVTRNSAWRTAGPAARMMTSNRTVEPSRTRPVMVAAQSSPSRNPDRAGGLSGVGVEGVSLMSSSISGRGPSRRGPSGNGAGQPRGSVTGRPAARQARKPPSRSVACSSPSSWSWTAARLEA